MDVSFSFSPMNTNDVAAYMLEGLEVERKVATSDLQQLEHYCATCTDPQHIQNKLIQLFKEFEQRSFDKEQLVDVLQVIVAQENLKASLTCHVFIFYKFLKLQELPYFIFPFDVWIEKEVNRVSIPDVDFSFLDKEHVFVPDGSKNEYENVCRNLVFIDVVRQRVNAYKEDGGKVNTSATIKTSNEGYESILVELVNYAERNSEILELLVNSLYYLLRGSSFKNTGMKITQQTILILDRNNRHDLFFLTKKFTKTFKKSIRVKLIHLNFWSRVNLDHENSTAEAIDVIKVLIEVNLEGLAFSAVRNFFELLSQLCCLSRGFLISHFDICQPLIELLLLKVEVVLDYCLSKNYHKNNASDFYGVEHSVSRIIEHYLFVNIKLVGNKQSSLFANKPILPVSLILKLSKSILNFNGVCFFSEQQRELENTYGCASRGSKFMFLDLFLMHCSLHKINIEPYFDEIETFLLNTLTLAEKSEFESRIREFFRIGEYVRSQAGTYWSCSPLSLLYAIHKQDKKRGLNIALSTSVLKSFVSNYINLAKVLIKNVFIGNVDCNTSRKRPLITILDCMLFPKQHSMSPIHILCDRETVNSIIDLYCYEQVWNPKYIAFQPFIRKLHKEFLSTEKYNKKELCDYFLISTLEVGSPSERRLDFKGRIANGATIAETRIHHPIKQFVHLLLGDYQVFEHKLVTKPTPEAAQFFHLVLANQERISQQSSELQVLLNQFNQFETLTPYQQRRSMFSYLNLLLTEDEKEALLVSKKIQQEHALPNELASLFYPINHLSQLGKDKLASSLSILNESLDSFTFDKEKFEDKVEVIEQQVTQIKAFLARVASKTIDVESTEVNQAIEQAVIQGKGKSYILDTVTGSKQSTEGFKQALNILLQSKTINDFDTQIVQLLLNFHDEQLELLLQAENEVDVYSLAQTLELSRLTINCVASAAPEKEESYVIGQVMTSALQVGATDSQRDDKALPLPLKVYMACYNGTLSQVESLPAWQAARDDGRINYPLLENLPVQMPEPCSLVEAEQRLKPNEMLVQLYQNEQGEICAILSSNKKVDDNENSSPPQSMYYRFSPKAKSEERLLLQEFIGQLSKSDNKKAHSVFSSHSTALKKLWSNDENGLLSTLWHNCHELGIETVILLISGELSVLPWEWLLQKEVNLKEINQDHASENPLYVKRIISLSHFRNPDDKANKTKAGMVYIYDTHDKKTYFRHGEYQTFNRYFTSHARFFNWRNWFKRLTLKTISESTPVDIIQGLSNVEHCHIHLHASYNGKDPRNINIEAGEYKLPLWSLSHCSQVPKRIYFSSCESGMHGMTEQRLLSPVGLAPTMVSKGTEEVVAPLWKVNQLVSFVFYHFLYEIQRKSLNKYRLPDLERSVEQAKEKMREMSLKSLIQLLRQHNPGEFDISQLAVFYEGEPEPTISTSWLNQKIKRYYAWRNKAVNQQVAPINFKDMLKPLEIKQFFWEKKGLRFEPKPLDSKPFASPFWWCGFVVYSRK